MNQARAPRGGEEGIAPEVQGRHRQPADPRHTGETQAQQVCGLLVGLREEKCMGVDEDGERSNGMGMTGAGYIKSLSRMLRV